MEAGRGGATSGARLRGWRPRLSGLVLALLALAMPVAAQTQDAGQRPIVRAVRVEGNARYTDAQLAASFGQAVGQPLLPEPALRRGIEVLFSTFHVRTSVELLRSEDGLPGEIVLLLRVEELPLDLELRIVGNSEIDDDEVREWAGLGEREELYLYQAPRIRQRLLQKYHEEGYYFAAVKVVERPAGVDPVTGAELAPDVIFEIEEGPEVQVADVELHGNHLLPNGGFWFLKHGLSKLAGAELRAPRLFGLFAKDFVPETLDADIVAMREVYRDLGYLDAVVELQRLEFSSDREWVTIHIAIDEGPAFHVSEIEIQTLRRVRDEDDPRGYREEPAEPLVPASELLPKLALQPGDVFERRRVNDDHRTLREIYGQRGHVEHPSLPAWEGFHFLDPELVYDQGKPEVRVVYQLVQGEPMHIREILMQGNLHTQDRVLRSRVTVKPGQLADPTAIERSRARIESTGFFSPDTFHPDIIPPQVRYVETGDPAWKDLEFLVEEGGVLSFQISGGLSTTQGAFGTIQLRKGNFDLGNLPSSLGSTIDEVARLEAFHGAGQTLRLEASPGTERTYYDLYFFEPDIFRRHERQIGLALEARQLRRSYESHLEERRDYSARLSRQLSIDSSVFARFDLGTVNVDDIDTGGEPTLGNPLAVPQDLKDQEGESQMNHVDFGYEYNTVDNRITPRNGLDINLQSFWYDELWGSDFEFGKLQMQLDFYDEFDEDPDLVSDYVHTAFILGVGLPYADTDEIPYTERWFLGGQVMRGFDFRGVGPNENGFPIGGTTELYATLEYRRPLVKNLQPGSYREVEAIQGGAFIDFGLLDPEELSLDFDELRISAGFLFGISFPMPLTFSFGFPLRDFDGDDTQVFEFEVGF